jgi:ribonuclease T
MERHMIEPDVVSNDDNSNETHKPKKKTRLGERFRGFLPVVVDLETGGFNAETDALLEIAMVILDMDQDGTIFIHDQVHAHIQPFEGANLEPAALEFTGIDPYHPLRMAETEKEALGRMFKPIRDAIKHHGCNRAVLVGHNAHFDLGFLNQAIGRSGIKRAPFHPFSCFDTATLGGLAYGQTVLARACDAAGLEFNHEEAHSARYDADLTAQLFCEIVNRWRDLGGWNPNEDSAGQ